MGIFDLFQKTSKTHKEMVVPKAVTPKEIPEKQLQQDLNKLKEFEQKIKANHQTEVINPSPQSKQLSQEEMALKLQNPFRGA